MDYTTVIETLTDVVTAAMPIGVMIIFIEYVVNFFLKLAFPKRFKD